ncbi:MAG: ABC transporter permease [Catenulispora sp. 13_1_20CM_3_70_7]|nr:MAG: ABC transporter permease [Catenulispora sp. 13_1_20CM_3_70_7]
MAHPLAGPSGPSGPSGPHPLAGHGRSPLRIPVRVRAGFLIPAAVILLGIIIWPAVDSIWLSLHNHDGSKWVGLHNYKTLFSDQATLKALKNNVIWVVCAPTIACALGLMFALLSEKIRWSTAFKAVIFMPMAISFLAAGVIFELVYQQDPNQGVANAVAVGAGSFTSVKTYTAGSVVQLPLVGIQAAKLPGKAAQAAAPSTAPAPDQIEGTVWLDIVYGGGGTPNHIDTGKKGMPGISVKAIDTATGKSAGSASAHNDGTFTIKGLKPGAGYALEIPASNFAQPYRGIQWLGPSLVTPAIIASYLWIWAGFAMVLIAAGLASIPRELQEAARVDGANERQIFRRITVPLLAPVLLVVLVTQIINVLKVFDLVYVIAPGSTLPDANVLAVHMWSVSFGGGQDQGLGSAIGVFLYILVLPAMYFNIRRLRTEKKEGR